MPSSSEYLAVPGGVSATAAEVWIGTSTTPPGDSTQVVLQNRKTGARWPVAAWKSWEVPKHPDVFVKYQRVPLTGLTPNTPYTIDLVVAGQQRASVDVQTLPDRLPTVGESPFILLLGSCFCRLQDASGRVGRAFKQLPAGAKPHVKCLVGDQVYLDSPWYRFGIPRSEASLAAGFYDHYLSTWGQLSDAQGFNHLLAGGANYFCPDDHEFWNNAPFPSSFAPNTWREDGRESWLKNAKRLYAAFQCEDSPNGFTVDPLKVLVLDTRTFRDAKKNQLLRPADLEALRQWVKGLTAPGVIVLGQPIFSKKAGVMGNIADWNFPNFTQYEDICRILFSSPQSILVLTGDVHYGRLSSARLPSGIEILELISSPMALVDKSAGGKFERPPDKFPAEAIAGLKSADVVFEQGWQRFANHFVTLEFTQHGDGIQFVLKSWETEGPLGRSMDVATRKLMVMRR